MDDWRVDAPRFGKGEKEYNQQDREGVLIAISRSFVLKALLGVQYVLSKFEG